MSKYLDRLKTVLTEKGLPTEPSKPSKASQGLQWERIRPPFEGFEGTNGRRISQSAVPPFDADGVPCGGCPSCGLGEFWRYPVFHAEHDPRGWVCWFCSPPPVGSGPCDHCGVPDQLLRGDAA
jgi:hypothetical protein